MKVLLGKYHWGFMVFSVMLAANRPGAAGGLDLHWLWEDRCMECHGHAADFARAHLRVSGNELVGNHPRRDLRLFLGNHYAAGSGEVDGLYRMLKRQAQTPPKFREECSGCHDSAARLVRDRLDLRDGTLYLRGSDESVRAFLGHHFELDEEEADFFAEVLTSIAREVYRP